MEETKRGIILEEGVPVEVYDSNGVLVESTHSLIGKAVKQSQSIISLEYHREGQFVSDSAISGGHIVKNSVIGDTYLTIASMNEVIGSELVAKITRMVVCNSTLTVEEYQEVADEFGNITRTKVPVIDGLNVYVESVDSELVQVKHGLLSTSDYLVFMPTVDVEILDTITLSIHGNPVKFKVESIDNISYEGIAVLGVCTETRK